MKTAREHQTFVFLYFWPKSDRERQKVPVKISKDVAREPIKSAREKVQKSARERSHLPVIFLKKCP